MMKLINKKAQTIKFNDLADNRKLFFDGYKK